MIKIESVTIKDFRGIRDLTLEFNQDNFAVCGPNGTGKSGIVDALEFVLTGTISRLAGEGRGEISVKDHGPHVDKRNDPAKAHVTAKIFIPSLQKTATIERDLKNPNTARVLPDEPEILEVLRKVESHPEIVLSRRELIRYVLATPGKRAEEVQALLHLDQIEQVRANFQKIANAFEKQIVPMESNAQQARQMLLRALGVTDLAKEQVITAANVRRQALGLPDLTDLTQATSLKDGLAAAKAAEAQRIPKTQSLTDIKAVRESLAQLSVDSTEKTVVGATSDMTALASDPIAEAGVKQETFLRTAIELAEKEQCPVCDTQWDLEKLKTHIQSKISHLEGISLQRKTIAAKIFPLCELLRDINNGLEPLIRYGNLAAPMVATPELQKYRTCCKSMINSLESMIPLATTLSILSTLAEVPSAVLDEVDKLEKAVAALPEPNKQDEAREWLTLAQERLEVWREAMRTKKIAQAKAETARKVAEIYGRTSDQVLTGIYSEVEKDFASLYSFVNRSDEEKFQAKLTPSLGKLGFDVDFYGRGFFPPGAYHSEGHQDGMGLCLYLALMRHLQRGGFTFAVLDDVLMSVDVGHRREVCTLLKKEFPETQFVMTTHDPIWLRHMRTEGLVGSRNLIQFRGWTVDQGPTRWDGRDVWAEIDDYLKANDVRAAAALLRHYLEYEATELCHRLRAPVEFRGDAQYQLGELLPAATKHMRSLLKQAKMAANSWNKKDVIQEIATREGTFIEFVNESRTEQWQVNIAVHFNSWANLSKEEFTPVVRAFKALLATLTCSDCDAYVHVLPDRESAESVRCGCNAININLKAKEN
ncbi:MAG: AAA family ATPase [Elusimicrobiota bacterium]